MLKKMQELIKGKRSSFDHSTLCVGAIITVFIIRFILLVPVGYWGWDEYGYLSNAHAFWQPGSAEFTFRQLLYPWLISFSFYADDHYFLFVKMINLALFGLGIFAYYKSFRILTSRKKALIGAFLLSCCGMLSMAGHAMTESLLFALYALIWSGLVYVWRGQSLQGKTLGALTLGVSIALALFTSPKFLPLILLMAFILIPAYLIHRSVRQILDYKLVFLAMLSLGATYAGLYCAMPKPETGFYDGLKTIVTLPHFWTVFMAKPKIVMDTIIGHLGVNLLFFSPMVGVAIAHICSAIYRKTSEWVLPLLTILCTAMGFAIALIFQVSLDPYSPIISTMFFRYYFFLCPPLLYLMLTFNPADRGQRAGAMIGLFLGIVCALYSTQSGLSSVNTFSGIESSEFWSDTFPLSYKILIGFMVATALLFVIKSSAARCLFMISFVINGAVGSFVYVRETNFNQVHPCQYLKQYLASSNKIAFAGPDRASTETLAMTPPFSLHRVDEVALYEELLDGNGRLAAVKKNKDGLHDKDFLLVHSKTPDSFSDPSVSWRRGECVIYDLKRIKK